MNDGMGRAVVEVRQLKQWSQRDLAAALTKRGSRTHEDTVSKWERGLESPCPAKRRALSLIAEDAGSARLAAILRAPIIAWHLLSHLLPEEEKAGR
jgi:transcriptional regulator with XRE-family HTH domain